MTQVQVELEAQAMLGEGARWHVDEQRLYWVDILQHRLHRYDPASRTLESRTFDAPVGCFAFIAGGSFMLAMKDGFAFLSDWDAQSRPFGEQILSNKPYVRMNDGRVDSAGRFWAGGYDSSKTGSAALYCLDGDGSITLIEGDMMTSNGAAFDADGKRFYHADTSTHAISVYAFDATAGTLSDKKTLHQFPFGNGRPDGGSVDAEGCYWSALYDGARIVRLSPDGEILSEIPLPVTRPTMISFGGEDLCTAFVTCARAGLTEEQLAQQPLAGALFSFRVDTPGLPEHQFVLR